MSSEKPPSIAPKRPAGSPRGASPVGRVSLSGGPAGPTTAPGGPLASPGAAPGAAPTGPSAPGNGAIGEAPSGGSFADRLKKATGSVRGSAGGAGSAEERPVRVGGDVAEDGGPRRVRLSVARIDPWSVMKLSFLLSVAVGVMIVIAAAVIWQTLNNMAVFTQVNDLIGTLISQPDYDTVLKVASFERVISVATMIAVVDVVLLTALSTIMAFLYNIVAALVGGLHVTLTDD